MLVRTEAVHFSHPTFPTSPLKLLTQTGSHRLVDAGNPPHRHTACAAAHRACPYHCLVALEAGPSSRRKALIPETKNATVVLTVVLAECDKTCLQTHLSLPPAATEASKPGTG